MCWINFFTERKMHSVKLSRLVITSLRPTGPFLNKISIPKVKKVSCLSNNVAYENPIVNHSSANLKNFVRCQSSHNLVMNLFGRANHANCNPNFRVDSWANNQYHCFPDFVLSIILSCWFSIDDNVGVPQTASSYQVQSDKQPAAKMSCLASVQNLPF